MKRNILSKSEPNVHRGTLNCQVIEEEDSEGLKAIVDILGNHADIFKYKRINIVLNRKENREELSLVVNRKNGKISLTDFNIAMKELVWFCEDLDTYSVILKGLDKLELSKEDIDASVQRAFKGYDIEVCM